jgi:hypothetical protein
MYDMNILLNQVCTLPYVDLAIIDEIALIMAGEPCPRRAVAITHLRAILWYHKNNELQIPWSAGNTIKLAWVTHEEMEVYA